MRASWRDLLIHAAAAVFLLAATLPWVSQLGMEYDEAHFLPLAVELAYGGEQRLERPWGFTLAGRAIPFVTMPYVGTLDAFLYAAAYRIWGTSVEVSRGVNLALAFLIGALGYRFLKRAGDWRAGAILWVLLLVDVEWVLHAPTNFGPFLLQQLLLVAALLCLQNWWRNHRSIWLVGAFALLALGFHEKFTFLWVVSSLGAGLLVWERQRMAGPWRDYALGLLAALLVVSPLLYFMSAVPEVVLGFGQQSTGLRAALWDVVTERAIGLWRLLGNAATVPFTTGVSVERTPVLVGLFLLGCLGAGWRQQRLALALYTAAAGVWAWNLVFPDAGRAHHLLLMGPLWHLGAALGLQALPRPALALALLLLGWSAVDSGRIYRAYAQAVETTRGVNHWSAMTQEAAAWLDRNPEWEPITTLWGIARVVETLTGGRRKVEELYFEMLAAEWSQETKDKLRTRIRKAGQAWLVSNVMPQYTAQWNRVVDLAGQEGKQPLHLKRFSARTGGQWIDAYTFTPLPAPVEKWLTESKREFRLSPSDGRLRIRISPPVENGQLRLVWLDAGGEIVRQDYRNFYWQPLRRGDEALVFGPASWPRSFQRRENQPGLATRVRLEGDVALQSVEVAAPRWSELEEYASLPPEFHSSAIGEYEREGGELIILEHLGKLHGLRDRRELWAVDGLKLRLQNGLACWEADCYRRKPEPNREFRIQLQKPLPELRRIADAASPPRQPANLRAPELVDLRSLGREIRLDIRYATADNFMGAPLYSQAVAWLQRPAAEALARAAERLAQEGFGLLVYDAYRPWRVTKMFWDATPEAQRNFVANPERGSRHNRGCAVDLTLYDRRTGKAVQMPSGFDEFSPRAWPDYPGGTSRERYLRWRLRQAMESEGFRVNDDEWWHFDYQDWEQYPVLNISFEQLVKR